MYIEGLEEDEERVEIFEYFLELMKHVPQISSSIIQLIQVNFFIFKLAGDCVFNYI